MDEQSNVFDGTGGGSPPTRGEPQIDYQNAGELWKKLCFNADSVTVADALPFLLAFFNYSRLRPVVMSFYFFFNTSNILKYKHTCSLYKPLPFFSTGSSVPLHIAWGPGLKLCSWYGGVLASICEGQGFLGQAGVDPGVPSSRRRSYTGVEQSVLCWLLDFSFCAARLRSTRLIDETWWKINGLIIS